MTETGDRYPLEKNWHISRGIPLGLIFSLLGFFAIQSGTAVWFFAHQDSRIDAMEKVQIVATALNEKLQGRAEQEAERLARLEEKVVSVQATANRIEALLTTTKR